MKVKYSYSAEIIDKNGDIKHAIDTTADIYHAALSYLIQVFNDHWDGLVSFNGKKRNSAAERLIHATKENKKPVCDFDKRFPKLPSYLRRSAIQAALGIVSSYRSNHKNWEDSGKKGREPKLQVRHAKLPCFYDMVMFQETDDPCVIRLKLYVNHDWVWRKVHLFPTDVKYLREKTVWSTRKAPTLERHYETYFLRFAFEEQKALSDKPVESRRVCAVDLGVNNDAVCCILASDGTVLGRKFINFPGEKDQLHKVLGRIKRQQRGHGNNSVSGLWAYAKRLNEELARKIAGAIVQYAVSNEVDVIVFEHLDFRGKKAHGSKKQKLHMWKKNDIQNKVELNAHRHGMRVSRICAWGTSKLAFDGSGKVVRDEDNRSLCTFSSGKRYNCDLSASYNIGARYFIRERLKPLLVTEGSPILAKVPELGRRTSCTLSTLIALDKYLQSESAA